MLGPRAAVGRAEADLLPGPGGEYLGASRVTFHRLLASSGREKEKHLEGGKENKEREEIQPRNERREKTVFNAPAKLEIIECRI